MRKLTLFNGHVAKSNIKMVLIITTLQYVVKSKQGGN